MALTGVQRGAEANSAPPPADSFRLSDLLPRPLQKNPRLNLSIVTEMTKDGRALAVPTPEHPAYYFVSDGGLEEEGDAVAGDKPPPAEKLAEIMRSSLAASGYLPAAAGHPPTLVVHYRWGSFNHLSTIGGAVDDPEDMAVLKNLMERAALVGGMKFCVDFMRAYSSREMGTMNAFRLRDAQTDQLTTMTFSDLYFLLALAFDYDSAANGQKKLLWATKISTDSQGLAMGDTLPSLVHRAESYFGHDTNGPVLFHPRLFPGRVEIGEATVKGYLEEMPPPAEKTPPANKP
jgi:hypothetical protein